MRKKVVSRREYVLKRLFIILGCLLAMLVILVTAVKIVTIVGRNRLNSNANTEGPSLEAEENDVVKQKYESQWKDGWVSLNGKVYEYNDEIMTFLMLGIDPAHQGGSAEFDELTDGGQSDGIFLVILNPVDNTIKVLAINRDTETEIVMVGIGDDGTDIITKSQITNQHGFGGGREYSCELTRDAVSKLLYDIPIHGYMSINYQAIPEINDSVGGVTVTMNEDWTSINKGWTEGSTVTLKGNDAYDYVHYRDVNEFESQRRRLGRQKQYLTSFIKQAKAMTKEDITLPITIYNEISPYMVTDLSVDKVGYMISEYIDFEFDSENGIYTLEGTTVYENDGYEHFYPDEDAMRELIINLFYKEVDVTL